MKNKFLFFIVSFVFGWICCFIIYENSAFLRWINGMEDGDWTTLLGVFVTALFSYLIWDVSRNAASAATEAASAASKAVDLQEKTINNEESMLKLQQELSQYQFAREKLLQIEVQNKKISSEKKLKQNLENIDNSLKILRENINNLRRMPNAHIEMPILRGLLDDKELVYLDNSKDIRIFYSEIENFIEKYFTTYSSNKSKILINTPTEMSLNYARDEEDRVNRISKYQMYLDEILTEANDIEIKLKSLA